jgi:anti-sigma regulatory factor (Ser/Thr protein kinase)
LAGSRVLLVVPVFALGQIRAVRHEVSRVAAGAGLTGDRLTDFVTAVNEITSNAVRHGGGSGALRLWSVDGLLCCEVTDEGHGVPAELASRRCPPSTVATNGRGLWLARQLCDVVLTTGPDGTTVRVSAPIRDPAGRTVPVAP